MKNQAFQYYDTVQKRPQVYNYFGKLRILCRLIRSNKGSLSHL
jgi:hypothetical protein